MHPVLCWWVLVPRFPAPSELSQLEMLFATTNIKIKCYFILFIFPMALTSTQSVPCGGFWGLASMLVNTFNPFRVVQTKMIPITN